MADFEKLISDLQSNGIEKRYKVCKQLDSTPDLPGNTYNAVIRLVIPLISPLAYYVSDEYCEINHLTTTYNLM